MPRFRVPEPQSGIKLEIEPGTVFARLTVISEAAPLQRYSANGAKNGSRRRFNCRCECGRESTVDLSHLRNGHTASCDCIQSETVVAKNYRHGMATTIEYVTWQSMLARCRNPVGPNAAYVNVSVCPEWATDFMAFFNHVGPRPSGKHSIDRYPDCEGDYRPGNVRWATIEQQQRNKRNTMTVQYAGETRVMMDVAEELGISPFRIRDRIYRGVSEDRLLEKSLLRLYWKMPR